MWTHTVAHGWGCLISWLISSNVARWLHWTRPNRCLSWQIGLPELMVIHIADMAQWLQWTWPDRCLPWIRKNLMCDCWGSIYQLKVPFLNRKPKTVAIRPRSQSDYKQKKKGSFNLHILFSFEQILNMWDTLVGSDVINILN